MVWTQTGTTARVFSKHHFPVPIIAMSPDHRALRRMALHYGVIPQEMSPSPDLTALIAKVDEFVLANQYAQVKDRILIVAGWSPSMPGTMNGIVIHTVGDAWTPVPTAQMLRQMVKVRTRLTLRRKIQMTNIRMTNRTSNTRMTNDEHKCKSAGQACLDLKGTRICFVIGISVIRH